ncbi:MAG: DoxX family protein [Rhodobacter sp.]|nr:DoxX family protein [Rhodobacter sp.]
MNALISLHNSVFSRLERLSPAVLPTLARLVFAATLLVYFWVSAKTKLAGVFSLDAGAYIQIFPRKFEAFGYDPSQFGALDRLIIFAGTYAEFILPLLIALGLFTRLASLGMIGFVIVQSLTDIFGHNADPTTIGTWFDKTPDAHILDQRAFWVFILIYLVLRGAGPLSLDALLARRHAASG